MLGFTVAIDGPAAAGKGTVGRAVAAHFGFAHLDTGLLYRAVGAKVLNGVTAEEAAETLKARDLESDQLRSSAVAEAAAIPAVRSALVDFQRSFAMRAGGAVLDGRDIGTVICPDAQVKLFITATPEVRAARRFAELSRVDPTVTLEGVLADVQARDARDSSRAEAPLRPAEDAELMDTSTMDIEAAVARAIALVNARRGE